MVVTRVLRSRARGLTAACTLSAAALLGASACGSAAEAVQPTRQPTQQASEQPTPTTTATTATGPDASNSSQSAAGQASATKTAATSSAAAKPADAVPECGSRDLKISWGYGTQSEPSQAAAVVFANVSRHTCTLRGYPGVAIEDGTTVIDAVRVLNGFRGDQPPLSSPPLVTLAPSATSYAVVQWTLSRGQACYPSGTGTFEATAPDTTGTIVLSHGATMGGRSGICSGLEVNPVVPGVFGAKVV